MAYTNSPMVSYTKLSPNHSGQRTHAIDRITPHCVVGQATAERIAEIFTPTSRQASCNYGIGYDGRISLVVEEKNRSWCSSSKENDQRAITIEVASDTTAPYAFKDAAYTALINLCIDICKRNGKKKLLWLADKAKTLAYDPASDEMLLSVHRWFANKSCPGDWMYARMGDLASNVTAALGGETVDVSVADTNLKQGSTGDAVQTMQTMLIACGFSCGSTGADGDFGNNTLAGLIAFQTAYGLTADGVYGDETKAALEKAYANRSTGNGETAAQLRARIVNRAISYLGCNEADGSHKKIIDLYNSQNPLPVGYKVTYSDAWCATFASAVAVAEKLTDIIPTECGCDRHIALFKKIGRWVEDDAFVPSPGDYIFYDWDDSGSGDNTGSADHVGIVVSVSGNTIKVIEGNKSDAVGYRNISVNGRYIRGYGVPDYEGKAGSTAPEEAAQAETDEGKAIWDRLYAGIQNPYGVAGVLANFKAESNCQANNLQNTYEKKLGMTDEEYTAAVDNGSYSNFVHDSAGYGLFQATYWSIKESLLNYAKEKGASIGDRDMQVDWFLQAMKNEYTAIWKVLTTAKSVREASDAVLLKFERPADQSEAVQERRAAYGEELYAKYAGGATAPTTTTYYRVRKSWSDKTSQIGAFTVLQNAKNCVDANPGFKAYDDSGNQVYPEVSQSFTAYRVKVSITDLNYRKGPSTSYASYGYIPVGVYTIVDEQDGWGLLKAYAAQRNGWIKLSYTTRI